MVERSHEEAQGTADHTTQEGGTAGGLEPIKVTELLSSVGKVARANPHTAVVGALALGFVLGGGLTPRLLASIALMVGREMMADAARDTLENAVRQQIDAMMAGSPEA